MQPVPRQIAAGTDFLGISDDRFKTARLTVALLLPLTENTASSNAVLPFLLRRSCTEYPSFAALQHRLNQLYGARIVADVSRIGDCQAMILTAVSIDDRFTLQREEVALQCAGLLRSMIFRPILENGAFPKTDTDQEKRCLAELIQSEINEKRLYARHRCEQILCEGEGYAVNRYGMLEGVNALTSESAAGAWRDLLRSASIRVIYQGSGSGDAIAQAFGDELNSVSGRAPADFGVKSVWDVSRGVRDVTERLEINQSKLVMGFRTSKLLKDTGLPAMRMMNALLGGTPHSLLFKNVRERLGLCYYCSSSFDRLGGVMLVDSGVEEQNVPKAREEILRQIDSICNGNFTAEETESARYSLINQFRTLGDLQSSLSGWYVGQSLDADIVTPEQVAEEIAGVTREQIIDAARQVRLGAVYMLAGEEMRS